MGFPTCEKWKAGAHEPIAHRAEGDRRIVCAKPQCRRDHRAGVIFSRRENRLQFVASHLICSGTDWAELLRVALHGSTARRLRGVIVECGLASIAHAHSEAEAVAQSCKSRLLGAFYAE